MTFEEMAKLTRDDITKLSEKEIVDIGFEAMCGLYYGFHPIMGRVSKLGFAPEPLKDDIRRVLALCDELC